MENQELPEIFIKLYEDTFENFTNQFGLFIQMATNGDSISEEIFSQYATNLFSMLNSFERSLTNNERFKNFYGPKIEFYRDQIRDLSSVYTTGRGAK